MKHRRKYIRPRIRPSRSPGRDCETPVCIPRCRRGEKDGGGDSRRVVKSADDVDVAVVGGGGVVIDATREWRGRRPRRADGAGGGDGDIKRGRSRIALIAADRVEEAVVGDCRVVLGSRRERRRCRPCADGVCCGDWGEEDS